MFKKFLSVVFLLVSSYFFCLEKANAQQTAPIKKFKSTNQLQSEYYSRFNFKRDEQWDSLNFKLTGKKVKIQERGQVQQAAACSLKKRVFGWFPYWVGNVYQNLQWDKVSDLCYFDYAVNSSNGNNTNTSYNWTTSAAVTTAKNNGVNVHICVTLFSNHATFFSNSTAQQNLITKLINDVKARNGKGINIDFEAMYSSSLKTGFTNFMKKLSDQLHAAVPGSELSVAVQWESNVAIDFAALNSYVDLWIHMGYDYSTGQEIAGPSAPLNKYPNLGLYLTSTVNAYLTTYAIPASKFILALPYYGVGWGVNSSCALGTTSNSAMYSYDISDVVKNTPGFFTTGNLHHDNASNTDYYCFTGTDPGGPNEFFIDGVTGMSARFDLINTKNIAGLGIWALGKDDGTSIYWNLIASKFATCGTTCADNYEPNGSKTAAYNLFSPALTQSKTKTINSFIFSGTDQDWYKIDVAAKGALNIVLSSLPADYNIQLRSSNGTTILKSSAHTGTRNDTIKYSYTSSSATSLYLLVYPKASSQFNKCNDYVLTTKWTPSASTSCSDIFEPNNSVSTATKVFGNPLNSGGSNYTMQGNIGAADDDDWYKVDIGACGKLTVNLSNLPYNYDVELYNSNGTTFYAGSYKTGTASEKVTRSFTGSGVTYVKVYAANFSDHTTASCYNLQFLWEPCATVTASAISSQPEFIKASTLLKTGNISPYNYTIKNIAPAEVVVNGAVNNASVSVTTTNAVRSSSNKFDLTDAPKIQLAPNPVHSTLNVFTTGLEQNKNIVVSVMSSSGVLLKTIQSTGSTRTIKLNVSSLTGGMYIIKIANGNKVMYRQFVKL